MFSCSGEAEQALMFSCSGVAAQAHQGRLPGGRATPTHSQSRPPHLAIVAGNRLISRLVIHRGTLRIEPRYGRDMAAIWPLHPSPTTLVSDTPIGANRAPELGHLGNRHKH